MTVQIPPEVASSICGRIREENRSKPAGPQAIHCRNCQACSGGRAIKDRGRACCPVRQRYAKIIAVAV